MALVLLAAGAGVYVLMRHSDAIGPALAARPVVGGIAFGIAWAALSIALMRWVLSRPRLVHVLGPVGPLAVLSASLPALGGFALLLLLLGPVSAFLRGHGLAGLALYIAGFALLAGLALMPTYAQAVLGGWAFGLPAGLPAALLGCLGGALIGYALGAWASGQRIVQTIDARPGWRAVRDALAGGGFFKTLALVGLVRLPPNSPFAITNLVLSSVRVAPGAYALGTVLGMAPRTAVAVYLASLIEGELSREAIDSARPAWLLPAAVVASLGVLVLIGHLANRAIARVTAAQAPRADA